MINVMNPLLFFGIGLILAGTLTVYAGMRTNFYIVINTKDIGATKPKKDNRTEVEKWAEYERESLEHNKRHD